MAKQGQEAGGIFLGNDDSNSGYSWLCPLPPRKFLKQETTDFGKANGMF